MVARLGIQTTSAYYTDSKLDGYIKAAHRFATAYKKWPMTEGRTSTTYTGIEEWSFEGYKTDSFRILQIGGKRLQKLNFEDYQIFREEDDGGADRVYSDFGRTVFINPNIDLSGTLTAWGQYTPVDPDATDPDSETVFSGGDQEGNEAIVWEAMSAAMAQEKKEQESVLYHQKAVDILDSLWKKVADEQFNYQTHRTRGGMWKRLNVVDGGVQDDMINRDQFLF